MSWWILVGDSHWSVGGMGQWPELTKGDDNDVIIILKIKMLYHLDKCRNE